MTDIVHAIEESANKLLYRRLLMALNDFQEANILSIAGRDRNERALLAFWQILKNTADILNSDECKNDYDRCHDNINRIVLDTLAEFRLDKDRYDFVSDNYRSYLFAKMCLIHSAFEYVGYSKSGVRTHMTRSDNEMKMNARELTRILGHL